MEQVDLFFRAAQRLQQFPLHGLTAERGSQLPELRRLLLQLSRALAQDCLRCSAFGFRK